MAISILLSSSLAPVASNQALDITGRPPTIGIASLFDASGVKEYFIFLVLELLPLVRFVPKSPYNWLDPVPKKAQKYTLRHQLSLSPV